MIKLILRISLIDKKNDFTVEHNLLYRHLTNSYNLLMRLSILNLSEVI